MTSAAGVAALKDFDLVDAIDTRVRMRAPAPLARDLAFDAARRHSRLVRRLKVAVPAVAALAVAAFVGYVWLDPFHVKDVEIDLGKVNVSGDKLTMELPHLTGFNKKQEAYNVTARSASQHITAPGLIDLTDMEAVITMQDKSTATMKAAAGKFDSNAELMTLRNKVAVTSTKGYSADLASATIDFKGGTVKSDDPVQVNLAAGVIKADSLNILEGGSIITFRGNVMSTFQAKPKAETAAQPQGTNP